MHAYRAPSWLSGRGAWGGNLQTIWPALYSRARDDAGQDMPCYERVRWETPDGDFIDVDTLLPSDTEPGGSAALRARPVLVLFHGLEGSSRSHYSRAFAHWARTQGWAFVLPHFRGCSGELNRAPRIYHSGDYEEIDWILRRLALQHPGPLVAVGVSLGGNALLRWAQESGSQAMQVTRAVVAISSPVDLAAAGRAIGRGFNRHVYSRMFLNSMKPKALGKLAQYPGLFDESALRASKDLYTYDNVVTAPLHGFANTEDYWMRCSAKPGLKTMRDVPALVLNARNDPFVPHHCLPTWADVGPAVTLWQPSEGGHVGFPSGDFPGHVASLPQAVGRWLGQQL